MRGILGMVLVGLATGWWAFAWGGRTAWFAAGVFAALFLYMLLVYASLRSRRLQVERIVGSGAGLRKGNVGDRLTSSAGRPMTLNPGESLGLTYRIKLALPVPGVWLRIEERWVHQGTGETVTVRAYASAGFRGEAALAGRLAGLPRGPYAAAERLVTAGDAFGLLRVTRQQRAQGQLLALPHSLPAAAVPGAAEEAARARKRAAASLAVPQLRGTRPYAPGDPLRRIHWRSTARTGELRAKETELPAAGRQLLCLDAAGLGAGALAAPRPAGSDAPLAALWAEPALAAAVAAAAGLARGALARGQSVRLAVSDGRAGAIEAPPYDGGRLTALLAALATVPQTLPRPEAFAELVAREALAAGSHGVTAVTARPDPGLVAALRRLKKGAVHVFYVHGPWSRSGGVGASQQVQAWQRELEALGCRFTLVQTEQHLEPQGGNADAAV